MELRLLLRAFKKLVKRLLPEMNIPPVAIRDRRFFHLCSGRGRPASLRVERAARTGYTPSTAPFIRTVTSRR